MLLKYISVYHTFLSHPKFCPFLHKWCTFYRFALPSIKFCYTCYMQLHYRHAWDMSLLMSLGMFFMGFDCSCTNVCMHVYTGMCNMCRDARSRMVTSWTSNRLLLTISVPPGVSNSAMWWKLATCLLKVTVLPGCPPMSEIKTWDRCPIKLPA